MVCIKTFSIVSLTGLLLITGLTCAQAATSSSDGIPPDMMQGEFRDRFGEKLKAMSPEERKAVIERWRTSQNAATKQLRAMTPQQHAQAKALREKVAKATPAERDKMKDTLSHTLPKMDKSNEENDIHILPPELKNKKEVKQPVPAASGSMLPAGH